MDSYTNGTRHNITAHQFTEPQASMLIRHTLFIVFTIASVLGNTIVMRSIIMIPSKPPLAYILVNNLAFAELINSLLLPAIQVYDELHTWPFGAFLCHVISPLQVVMVLSITWTIVVISYLRYRALLYRPAARQWKAWYRYVTLVCIWGCAFGFASPAFVHKVLVSSPYDGNNYWCLTLFDGDSIFSYPGFNTFNLVRFTVNFCIPVVLMVWFYGAMVVVLKYHISRVGPLRLTTVICTRSSNGDQLDTTTGSPSDTSRSSYKTRVYVQDEDLLKMIFVVVAIFIVFYFPYQFLYILEHYQMVTATTFYYHHITRRYLFLLTCLPSALHPLCYGTVSQYYAKIFSCIFLCKCVKRTTTCTI